MRILALELVKLAVKTLLCYGQSQTSLKNFGHLGWSAVGVWCTHRYLWIVRNVVLLERAQRHLVQIDVGKRKVGVSAQMWVDVLWQVSDLLLAMLSPARTQRTSVSHPLLLQFLSDIHPFFASLLGVVASDDELGANVIDQ